MNKGQGSDTLYCITVEGTLRAWDLRELIENDLTPPMRIICYNIVGSFFISVNPFDNQFLMVLNPDMCLV